MLACMLCGQGCSGTAPDLTPPPQVRRILASSAAGAAVVDDGAAGDGDDVEGAAEGEGAGMASQGESGLVALGPPYVCTNLHPWYLCHQLCMAGKGPTFPFPFTKEARQLLFNVIDSHNAAMDAGAKRL
jgi:hypothetical protein